MFKAHYKIRRVFDGHLMKSTDTVLDDEFLRPEESKVRWLGGDTDSSVIQIFDEADPKIALADSNLLGGGPFFDVGGDAKSEQLVEHLAPLKPCSRDLVLRNAGALGNFSDELAPHYAEEWVGLAPKMYSLKKAGCCEDKSRAKGVPKVERKRLLHEDYLAILESGGEHRVNFCRLGCTALNAKVWQLNSRQSRPLGHFKNNKIWGACWVALLRGERRYSSCRGNTSAFYLMSHVLSYITGERGFLHREIVDGKFKGRLFNLSYLRNQEDENSLDD